ncbi:hypothetical protein ERJ75_001046400 [Trypanosoma vivax]|nr:hypothetical protein ERJ75_001046400 [Trypanosoma vivax]
MVKDVSSCPEGESRVRYSRIRWSSDGKAKKVMSVACVSGFTALKSTMTAEQQRSSNPQPQRSMWFKSNGARAQQRGKCGARFTGKRKDPNAPLNHRARYSRLKRSIMEKRKFFFDYLKNSSTSCDGDTRSLHDQPSSASPSPAEHHPMAQSGPMPLQRMELLVTRLHAEYAKLHSAMRQKDYVRAASYIRSIRLLRKRLHAVKLGTGPSCDTRKATTNINISNDTATASKQALTVCGTEESAAPKSTPSVGLIEASPHVEGVSEPADMPNFMNFYPSLTQLGVGRRRHAVAIDCRSNRHPQRLGQQELSRVSSISEEELSAQVVTVTSRKPVALYCLNIITDDLEDLVFTILQKQYTMQSRMKKEKPLQFKARRLYSTGLKETLRALRAAATRIPVVLLASDIEVEDFTPLSNGGTPCPSAESRNLVTSGVEEARGGTFERKSVQELGVRGTLEEIRNRCALSGIPLVTCMSRRRLAYALYAKGSNISSVVLHSAEGVYNEVRILRSYVDMLFTLYKRNTLSDEVAQTAGKEE